MEETPASRQVTEIDLLNNLENKSSVLPNRILKVEVYILNKLKKNS